MASLSRSGIVSLIAGVIALGILGIFGFVHTERNRDMIRWQEKLNIIADSRARDVNGWVQNQFSDLTALANNASLQIYFLTVQEQPKDASFPPAESDYLRNLLTTAAERLGFQPPAATVEQESLANVRKLATGGLALVDKDGKQRMATSGMPPVIGALAEKVKAAPRGAATLMDIEQSADGTARMGFIIPVYGIQAEHTAASQIGTLVGIRTVDEHLFDLLTPPPSGEASTEIALVRAEGDKIRYLTPLHDKSPLMSQREAAANTSAAAAFAIAHPGSFAEKTDYSGTDVLVTSRQIQNTPWTLVVKVNRAEAFGNNATWLRTMVAAFAFLTLAVVSTLIAVWRTASARRAIEMSEYAQKIAAESSERAELLSLVTSHQAESLYIVDAGMCIRLINEAATKAMATNAADAQGKPLSRVMGPVLAREIEAYCSQALTSGAPHEKLLQRMTGKSLRTISATFVPLDHIPIASADPSMSGVLIAEKDITDVLQEREKRSHTLNQIISMLVSLIDRRDPNASQHSTHVAAVAVGAAREMGLDALTVETAATAARLMNLGKMNVPAELLTRAGALNSSERSVMRDSMAASAKMLEGIEFEGPVVDTLRQAQETYNGTGPLKLKGDNILITARIVATANAIVGMLSPRAYRQPISLDDAVKLLQVNPHYDPKVVAAVTNYVLNHMGTDKVRAIAQAA